MFEQSGHWIQHDEPELFHATVSRFLAGGWMHEW